MWIGSVVLAGGIVRDLVIASTSKAAQDRARNLALALRLGGQAIVSRQDNERLADAATTAKMIGMQPRPYGPHPGDYVYFGGADIDPVGGAA